MPLTDIIFFADIPHAAEPGKGVNESLLAMIDELAPAFLRASIGPSMYDALAAGLAAGSVPYFSDAFSDAFLKSTLAPRWEWLMEGHTYTIDGAKVVWGGLKRVIAEHIKYCYREKNFTKTQSTGDETTGKFENAERVAATEKMVAGWNWAQKQLEVLLFILLDSGVYPEFVEKELYYNRESGNVYNRINTFGI